MLKKYFIVALVVYICGMGLMQDMADAAPLDGTDRSPAAVQKQINAIWDDIEMLLEAYTKYRLIKPKLLDNFELYQKRREQKRKNKLMDKSGSVEK